MKLTTLIPFFLFCCGTCFGQYTHRFEVISAFDTVWVKKETLIKAGTTLILPPNAYIYAIHQGTVELTKWNGRVNLVRVQTYTECLRKEVGGLTARVPVRYTESTWEINLPTRRATAVGEDVVLSWISLYKEPKKLVSKGVGNKDVLYDRSTGTPIAWQ